MRRAVYSGGEMLPSARSRSCCRHGDASLGPGLGMCTVAAERVNATDARLPVKRHRGDYRYTHLTLYNKIEYRVYMHAGSVSLVTFLNRLGCERNLNVHARARAQNAKPA